jgi:uncharacterized protein (TIGR03083 family)
MNPPAPILVSDLFPELRSHLLSLLDSLAPDDWRAPTTAGQWTVKDVALHILGGDLGNLSRRRDQHSPPTGPIADWNDLVAFINCINQSWVDASQRLSTPVLRDLLNHSGRQADEYFMSLNPFAPGTPVSWAGPDPAPNWLDIAREYTERWHHQQQIRDATHRPGLYAPRLFAPVLDTFVRALPRTFRDVAAPANTTVQLIIPGEAGGHWTLQRTPATWELYVGAGLKPGEPDPSANEGGGLPRPEERREPGDPPTATVTIAPEIAWKIFTHGIRGQQVQAHANIQGDQALGAKVLETVSVIA